MGKKPRKTSNNPKKNKTIAYGIKTKHQFQEKFARKMKEDVVWNQKLFYKVPNYLIKDEQHNLKHIRKGNKILILHDTTTQIQIYNKDTILLNIRKFQLSTFPILFTISHHF